MIAEVILHLGRFHLVINGVYLAMESDVCRDPFTSDARWTEGSLRQAAEFINEKRWESARARFDAKESTDA